MIIKGNGFNPFLFYMDCRGKGSSGKHIFTLGWFLVMKLTQFGFYEFLYTK